MGSTPGGGTLFRHVIKPPRSTQRSTLRGTVNPHPHTVGANLTDVPWPMRCIVMTRADVDPSLQARDVTIQYHSQTDQSRTLRLPSAEIITM